MKALVVIPTFNEKENITKIVAEVLQRSDINVLVVDDNSPDGTGKLADKLAFERPESVYVLHRTEKKGRGYAGAAGFRWALDHGYDVILEMDADFSHNPKYLPDFLKAIEDADVVLGSRQVEGGTEVGRHPLRTLITKMANLYIRIVLGLNVRDCNSGYRCFRRKVLEDINPDKIESHGPGIVQEVLFKAHIRGFRIKEIPIIFEERKLGSSKVNHRVLINGYFLVLKLKLMKLLGKL
ncbi:MAG: polyprenol monophosphomannose synthase [Candidatus Altiarchaeota archaeon]|nr:polyprenol monophosphomannose synthase [Candidatus Altiarchaeota archaeon]